MGLRHNERGGLNGSPFFIGRCDKGALQHRNGRLKGASTKEATMIASFEYELTRANEEDIFYLEIVYSGSRYGSKWNSEYEAELVSVMLDGKEFPTTAAEDEAILAAAYDQIGDDFTDDDCAYGDYINDLRSDR